MKEGEVLQKYIDNQKVSKSTIAKDLGMTRRNLYGLFASTTLSDDTKKKFEDYFKCKLFTGEVVEYKEAPTQEINYKDKHLKHLEQQLERREQELKEKGVLVEALLKDVKADLHFIKSNWIVQNQSRNLMAAMQQKYTDYFVEKLLKESPAKVLQVVNRKVSEEMGRTGKKGNHVDS